MGVARKSFFSCPKIGQNGPSKSETTSLRAGLLSLESACTDAIDPIYCTSVMGEMLTTLNGLSTDLSPAIPLHLSLLLVRVTCVG